MTGKILDREVVVRLAEIHGGLELNHVDDHNAFAVTVGELCATWLDAHETIQDLLGKVDRAERHMTAAAEGAVRDRAERDRAVTLLNAVLAVAVARRSVYEYLPAKIREALDKLIPPLDESREDRWLRLGYRVEWSEREPRAYEVRCLGSLPADNTCLARLPTVQDVDAWIAERVKGER